MWRRKKTPYSQSFILMWNEKDTENNNTHTDHLIKKHLSQGHSRTLPTSELHLDVGKKKIHKTTTHI
jgi:hypothetical protein